VFHPAARPATIRDQLINPARIANSARRIALHLPTGLAVGTPLASTHRRHHLTSLP
jgi:hypothetical protein